MSKYLLVKAGAVVLFALVATCAYTARAGEIVSNEVFATGTSFETHALGPFDPSTSERFDESDPDRYSWYAAETNDLGRITLYKVNEAYDYEAKGLQRAPCFTNGLDSAQKRYLNLTAEQYLDRAIFGLEEMTNTFSNVVVRTATRDSIYCDLLAQFSPSEAAPSLDETSRIAVWSRLYEDADGVAHTNLMVTAGCFTNKFTTAVSRTFRLDVGEIYTNGLDVTAWYRLTIRAHGDISKQGAGLAGFSIYLDGKPLRALEDDYEICDPVLLRSDWMTPEARALFAGRRLFPSRVTPGSDAAFTISKMTFLGSGRVDDISFSSANPGYGKSDSVFTLNWDSGFTEIRYSLDGGLTTNDAPVSAKRSLDILLGDAATNGLVLKVYAAYDTDHDFKPGEWLGSNGATVTNLNATSTEGEFVFDGTTDNPIAAVASTRETILVGPGGYETFASALAALDKSTNAVKTIALNADIVVSTGRDAQQNSDGGYVWMKNPNGCYELDLCGHTLQGKGRKPTLLVSCKSLRIYDSSSPDPATKAKLGRVLPVKSYTNASERLNTAVEIYPDPGVGADADGNIVEPTVTIEDGIYDGWVRNQVNFDHTTPLVGTLTVDGGSFVSTNSETFYLESSVTNEMVQYVFRDDYWSPRAETNLVIWTGRGDGLHWTDPKNWKVKRLPKSTETALFPSRAAEEGPWTVDVASNAMTTATLSLEGDVYLTGTNDFKDVTLTGGGLGRICGTATLVFEGEQPGKLTTTMLRDDWAGTVLVRNLGYPKTKVPKVLKNIETWGTASSTVIFHGVRGYVSDTSNHTMPYGLVLKDLIVGSVTNAAWQNDSGWTGSTLAYLGPLSGDGSFVSGSNARALLQLFKFANVTNFLGKFTVNGKRILIGSETVMSRTAGLIAFGDEAVVRAGLGWTCQRALFGESLYVLGTTNDILVTCTKAEPDVTCCSNVTLNGAVDVAWLATTNNPKWSVYVTGERPAWLTALDPDEPIALMAPLLAAAAPAATASAASGSAYEAAAAGVTAQYATSILLAKAAEAVESADISLELEDGDAVVVVRNAAPGLWYGVRHRASLAADWDAPETWKWVQATGSTVTLSYPVTGESGFYGIVVAVTEQTGGAE